MSQPSDSPVPYRVVYSEYVRIGLRELVARQGIGRGQEVLDAVKAIDHRLRIYPQFGEPLRDLKAEGETLWIGTIPPLVVQYVIDEGRRLVFVVAPFRPLSESNL